MAETKSTAARANGTASKAALQRELEQTRESMAETVEDIRETVSEQYQAVKETVSGVIDFREQFQNEPLVWSLGALSAGFALGYTTGYAHKEMKGKGKHSEVSAFTNSLVTDLSAVGKTMVMPTLNLKIRELFGFDFSDLLAHINQTQSVAKGRTRKTTATKRAGKRKKATKKTRH
ncbi:MAG: hypothetical protein QOK48_3045 [Blastocatellia bacterium]|jgi:hypothetical protein|nr:hypothetical protein [Blastocatellia bacterium]